MPAALIVRLPADVVLGTDLRAGDTVGSVKGWRITAVVEHVPGTCTDLDRARVGRCACHHPATADPQRMPQVLVKDGGGRTRPLFAHLWYARAAR